jgi:hypothetical protein
MNKQHLGKLSTADLNRWRVARARVKGIEARASNYSRVEIEAAFIDEWRLMAEFGDTYQLPEGLGIAIYCDTGLIEESED